MSADPNPPRHIGDLLGEIKLTPDCPSPDPRKQQCALCHLDFLSRPQWFSNKWIYPNVCTYCGDNYSHTQEVRNGPTVNLAGNRMSPRTELAETMGPKRFGCPSCYTPVVIKPIKEGAYWVYEGRCERCDKKWVNLYHAYKRPDKPEGSSNALSNPDDL